MALAWPNHIHHARAVTWFRDIRGEGWSTCPVTESGFVRVSCNTRAIPEARPPQETIELLRRMRELPEHTFWADDISPVQDSSSPFAQVVGYRQVTDAHLLTLAMRRGGRLATFDRSVRSLAPGAEDAVELIG